MKVKEFSKMVMMRIQHHHLCPATFHLFFFLSLSFSSSFSLSFSSSFSLIFSTMKISLLVSRESSSKEKMKRKKKEKAREKMSQEGRWILSRWLSFHLSSLLSSSSFFFFIFPLLSLFLLCPSGQVTLEWRTKMKKEKYSERKRNMGKR